MLRAPYRSPTSIFRLGSIRPGRDTSFRMRDAPRRRPPAQHTPPRRPLIAAVLRSLAVAAVVALVTAAGGPSGFWACVPAALLLAAPARGIAGSTAGVAVAVGSAAAASSGV